jgi:hypothetical protein
VVFAIENRTGAGAIIGAEAASRRHRSGRIKDELPSAPSADEQAICNLVDAPTVITVNSASPFKPVDLIEAARAKAPRDKSCQYLGGLSDFRIRYERLARGRRGYHFRPVFGQCSLQ